jgi:CheY-like chemotaxis protein
LEHLRASPDGLVVLLDLQMPGIDGMAVLRALATEPGLLARHVILVMTAYPERMLPLTVVQLLIDQGIPLLVKPFDLDTLLAAVHQAQAKLRGQYGEDASASALP